MTTEEVEARCGLGSGPQPLHLSYNARPHNLLQYGETRTVSQCTIAQYGVRVPPTVSGPNYSFQSWAIYDCNQALVKLKVLPQSQAP